jgi:hypothetical protein
VLVSVTRSAEKYLLALPSISFLHSNNMDFPFQCLVARSRTADGLGAWTLFGASGPKLVVQSSDGTISVWPQQLGRSMVSAAC